MLSCVRRLTSSSTQKCWSSLLLARNVETRAEASSTGASSSDATAVLEPYPLPDVFCGKLNGEQVDYIQTAEDEECLIDKMYALVRDGAYIYEYNHLKDRLDEADHDTRKCFMMKYASKDRVSLSLTKYLQAEIRKSQDPLKPLTNEMELKLAKYAIHQKNLHNHMTRFPRDRYNKKTVNINKAALLEAQKVLMKVNFQRYDWLMNELRLEPPIYLWIRGPFHSRYKPRDPEATLRFIRKHRLRALKVADRQAANEAKKALDAQKKYVMEQAAAQAAAGLIESTDFTGRQEIDYTKLPKNS